MSPSIAKRSAAKGGRDAVVMLAPATLVMQVVSEHVTLSDAEYSLLFAAVTMAVGFVYRVARDHGWPTGGQETGDAEPTDNPKQVVANPWQNIPVTPTSTDNVEFRIGLPKEVSRD